MTFSSYRITVPGKLLIAGDYAVLEPNREAVVVAVDRYITANIEQAIRNQLSIPQFGLNRVTWKMNDNGAQFNVFDSRLRFIQTSLDVASRFLIENGIELKPVKLTLKSQLNDPSSGLKYGMGSSAAIVVAVISAVLTIHSNDQFSPSLEQVFKLSAIAHLKTQKNGSGIDIAASTYGGWILYSAYRPNWVLNELQNGCSINELISKKWPNLRIIPIEPPESLKLCVGWTCLTASTAPMIKKVQALRDQNLEVYNDFLNESTNAVSHLIKAFDEGNCNEVLLSIKENRKALNLLSKQAGISIETSELNQLSNIAEKFGSGKSSGAGGGDCGIAILEGERDLQELNCAWESAGITPLTVSVSKKGVSVTEYNCEMSLHDYKNLGISS